MVAEAFGKAGDALAELPSGALALLQGKLFWRRLILDSRVVDFEDGVHWYHPMPQTLTGVQRCRLTSRI